MRQTLFAVYVSMDADTSLCRTYNPTHDVWMPAIFHSREDADKFQKEISSVKGYEPYSYTVQTLHG